MNDMDVIVYTKGSGKNENGRYGWAYTLEYMTSEDDKNTDAFRTEMCAVLSALKALDKSVSAEIRTNNESVAKICNGEYKADKSKDLYDEYKEIEESFQGNIRVTYIPAEERDQHFDEVKRTARNEKL